MTTRRSGRRAQAPAARAGPETRLILPAWRGLLEARWQERLGTVIRLSLAYHDAAEIPGGGQHARGHAETRQVWQLMQETLAARRALCDTEEALARLSAGYYGRCEQCRAGIAPARLAREPEARYCERCVRQPSRNPSPPRNVPRRTGPREASASGVASRNAPFGIKNEKYLSW
jgi:RNA polymerase-binding transcription factor DksA